MKPLDIEFLQLQMKDMLEKTFIEPLIRRGKNTLKLTFKDSGWIVSAFIRNLIVRNYPVEVKLVKPDEVSIYLRNLDKRGYIPEQYLDLLYQALDEHGCWKTEYRKEMENKTFFPGEEDEKPTIGFDS